VLVVECVDDQPTVDHHRVLLLIGIEDQSTAKPPYGRLARLMQRRVCPHGVHAMGRLWLGIRNIQRKGLGQIQVGASARHQRDGQTDSGEADAPGVRLLLAVSLVREWRSIHAFHCRAC